ncbi:class I mannose-6-phosphate isomerase [Salinispira pacifica]
MAEQFDQPIFFQRNRVRRVYTGGKLFHEFFGDPPEDGYLPEEWVASSVRALNREPSSEHEGVSLRDPGGERFDELLSRRRRELLGSREELGLLVKILDSAIRLPVQAHPTKAFARAHFQSPHGKTEMWIVLATRPGASIYYGLKEGVTKVDLSLAVSRAEEDRDALPSLLNRLPARPGDIYLIPAGVAHAIGSGCLILEVQEPTDFTIQPEPWCGDYHLDDREMYIGLDRETALDCFDYTDLVGERSMAQGRKSPRQVEKTTVSRSEQLIGPEDTPDFSVFRHTVRAGTFLLPRMPAVYVVTGGEGAVSAGSSGRRIAKGSYFFLPAAAAGTEVTTESRIELVECLPPAI